jgi:hypothetical protein
MAKTKVKQDEHGLYVRGAGYIWRPVFPVGYSHVHEDRTDFGLGDEVGVSHSGGPLASIRGASGREQWFAHGTYIDTENSRHIPSHECWKPSYRTWATPTKTQQQLPNELRQALNLRKIMNP